MHKTVLLIVAIAAPAFAEDLGTLPYRLGQSLAWQQDAETKEWSLGSVGVDDNGAQCKKLIAELDAAKAPASTKITLSYDTPELVKGDYTLADIRPLCDATDRYAKMAKFEDWGALAVAESQKIGGNQYYDTAIFERCLDAYNTMLKQGVKPTQKVLPKTFHAQKWTGTVEELRKKFCDVGLKKVQAEMAAKLAPYKKALKADKLAMVVPEGANAVRAYILAGGGVTDDPKKLASAAVWFSDTTPADDGSCKGEAIHIVHRYQFDGGHKLVKTTDKKYCGNVPASAYK